MTSRPPRAWSSTLAAAVLLAAAGVGPHLSAQAAPADSVFVSSAWLADRLDEPGVVVLFVGEADDFGEAHIPGARHLANESFITQRQEVEPGLTLSTQVPGTADLEASLEAVGVSNESRIVIYGGALTSLARLYVTLDHLGLGARTSILNGGVEVWRDEGRPLVAEWIDVPAGSLTLTPRTDVIADLATVRSAAGVDGPVPAGSPTIVDARTDRFYSGESPGSMPRAGRIPTAVNATFSSFVESGTTFRTPADLLALFRGVGVAPGGDVITYCHIGMQASVAYVAAKAAGLHPRMYDGSFDEWSRRSELPVEP